MKNFIAGTVNAVVLAGMVGVGAYQVQEAQAQQTVDNISEEELYCLQQNIFFEARNQSTLGQVAVAWVTINRMESNSYPDTICGVVWQNKQFSWTHDGKSDTPSDNVLEQRAWEDAELVAEVALLDWARAQLSPVEDAVMYHADWIEDPYWAASYETVVKIDNHIFYR